MGSFQMARDLLKVILHHFRKMTSFFYDYDWHLQETTWVKLCLCSWNKLDLVLLVWLTWFCLLGRFSSLFSILTPLARASVPPLIIFLVIQVPPLSALPDLRNWLSLTLAVQSVWTHGQGWRALATTPVYLSGILPFPVSSYTLFCTVFYACLLPQCSPWKALCIYPLGTSWASAGLSILRLSPQEKPGPICHWNNSFSL